MMAMAGAKCIFCGGQAAATTEEHCPPRSLFRGRAWPEGFAFPSCAPCNNGTSDEDLLVQLMASMQPDPDDALLKRFNGLMYQVNNQYPGLLRRMAQRSVAEARQMARELGVKPPPGSVHQDLSVVKVTREMHDAVAVLANKLSKAIYFIHEQKVFPSEGEIAFHWFTNAELLKHGSIPALEALKSLHRIGTPLKRNGKDLKDQFDYEYSHGDGYHVAQVIFGKVFGFVTFFNPNPGTVGALLQRMREKSGKSSGPFQLLQPNEEQAATAPIEASNRDEAAR
ncbi:MAG: hypothetical protein J7598_24465 [Mitsuaria chitosanitabida]|nr:hypothetical protein [Roseateles chitosanitabidus]